MNKVLCDLGKKVYATCEAVEIESSYDKVVAILKEKNVEFEEHTASTGTTYITLDEVDCPYGDGEVSVIRISNHGKRGQKADDINPIDLNYMGVISLNIIDHFSEREVLGYLSDL